MSVRVVVKFNKYDAFAAAVPRMVDEAITEVVAEVATVARELVAVDTGELRDSIDSGLVREGVAEAGAGTDHAIFVEFGTRNQAAQPYLVPAFEAEAPKTPEVIAQKFERFFH